MPLRASLGEFGIAYVFAILMVLTPLFGPGLPTYIFYHAIIIAALLAGLRQGLLTTIISVMVAGILLSFLKVLWDF